MRLGSGMCRGCLSEFLGKNFLPQMGHRGAKMKCGPRMDTNEEENHEGTKGTKRCVSRGSRFVCFVASWFQIETSAGGTPTLRSSGSCSLVRAPLARAGCPCHV